MHPARAAIAVAGATHRLRLNVVVLTLSFAVGATLPLLGFALAGRQVADRVKAFRTRAPPHVKAWSKVYQSAGLQVIGVHTPEFVFERDPGNVAAATKSMGITYPVALDNS